MGLGARRFVPRRHHAGLGSGIPIPRVFWKKRLQAAENKGNECEKERQERARVRKPLTAGELHGLGVEAEGHT
jgi:hypothetical protein